MRRKFFHAIMQQVGAPTAGYRALADLVQRQLVSTILTTNFDGLIEKAFTDRAPHIRSVITINKSRGDLNAFKPQNHPQIVYLHGSFDTYCDKNTIDETQELDKEPFVDEWAKRFREVQSRRFLVCQAPGRYP
jgi:NAD-dependent SIR2 family protein deacetylase